VPRFPVPQTQRMQKSHRSLLVIRHSLAEPAPAGGNGNPARNKLPKIFLRSFGRVLPIVEHRMNDNLMLFDAVENREWKTPDYAPPNPRIVDAKFPGIAEDGLDGAFNTIEKFEAQASTLPFIPDKRQFQVLYRPAGVAKLHLYLALSSS